MECLIYSKNYSNELLAALNQLRQEKVLCDVTLISEDQHTFHVHGCILSANSPFFWNYLKEQGSSHIELSNLNSKELELFLTVLYSGVLDVKECDKTEAYVTHLKALAIALELKPVIELCEEYIQSIKAKTTANDTFVGINSQYAKINYQITPSSDNNKDDSQTNDITETNKIQSSIKGKGKRGRPRKVKSSEADYLPSNQPKKMVDEAEIPQESSTTNTGRPKRKATLKRYSRFEDNANEDDEAIENPGVASSKLSDNALPIKKRKERMVSCHNDAAFMAISETGESVTDSFNMVLTKLLALENDKQDVVQDDNIYDDTDANPLLKLNVQKTFEEVKQRLEKKKKENASKKRAVKPLSKREANDEQLKDWKSCTYCSKFKGKKRGRFEFHTLYCHSTHKCTHCFKPFLNEADLNSHQCSKMVQHMCDICGKTVGNKQSLQLHKEVHKGIKKKMCPHCGKYFARACQLKQHVVHRHSSDRPFHCKFCDAKFPLKYELNRHMQRHTDTPQFLCPTCGSKFFEKVKLNNHVKYCQDDSENNMKSTVELPQRYEIQFTNDGTLTAVETDLACDRDYSFLQRPLEIQIVDPEGIEKDMDDLPCVEQLHNQIQQVMQQNALEELSEPIENTVEVVSAVENIIHNAALHEGQTVGQVKSDEEYALPNYMYAVYQQ
ncbi:unnamed protein product [Owenia fusiformis]|uniref:Uncharacterized protein n=1 Tax=Owenia fusiformis TaxID=6347 RepID=A0A8S4N4M5_OWEFU|nr:unnamed protein product [Owenia fusiformis]